LWTDGTPRDLAGSLQQAGRPASGTRVVRRSLSDVGCVRRQSAQGLPGGATAERDPPLGSMAQRKAPWRAAGHPVWSIATKQKACLGTLSRNGKVYGPPAQKAFDQDFPRGAEGVMVPQGLDDGARNHGGLQVGLSRDTTACACDSLRVDWESDGQQDDPQASARLLFGDGGGSHRGRKPVCKHDRQALVHAGGLPVRVAHSPASCAKFHPRERRLLCHVTRACQGVLCDSWQTVRALRRKTSTQTGWAVPVRGLDNISDAGRKVAAAFTHNRPMVFDTFLPKWNSRVVPPSG